MNKRPSIAYDFTIYKNRLNDMDIWQTQP
ncbi:hypothetical protein CGLO_13004 [Colletotrichum gloeosporioides Cg-14]|uniref:Uncharacterized protein n=1 Tax=Colletotrichum gloeosporioides (strain Cg-14) TaxID=1237896 RepID=T0K752_COLGC|nr:hypothetical protein CGLO_13004 [Colletotrichum gloeosporioides Cg-14]